MITSISIRRMKNMMVHGDISFVASNSNKLPHNVVDIDIANGRLVKVVALFGNHGSGKTTLLLDTMRAVQRMILERSPTSNMDIDVSIQAIINGGWYTYTISHTTTDNCGYTDALHIGSIGPDDTLVFRDDGNGMVVRNKDALETFQDWVSRWAMFDLRGPVNRNCEAHGDNDDYKRFLGLFDVYVSDRATDDYPMGARILSRLWSLFQLNMTPGGLLFIDNFDGMHPLVLARLLKYITDQDRVQALVGTHCASLLHPKILRRDQVIFMESLLTPETPFTTDVKITSLTDFYDDERNIHDSYLNGVYGGVPFVAP